jgi:peroxiredoxin Q/BCP
MAATKTQAAKAAPAKAVAGPAEGAMAPAFSMPASGGRTVSSAALKGKPYLLYFYPKADTPGCTTQSCGLRDIADQVGDTVIIGISPDLPAKLKKFDDKYSLGFTLLSDAEHTVSEAFGVWAEKSMYGKKYMGIVRSAFLVDEKGKLEKVWYKISPKDTPAKLLAALAE